MAKANQFIKRVNETNELGQVTGFKGVRRSKKINPTSHYTQGKTGYIPQKR